jgi:hypothetical protein
LRSTTKIYIATTFRPKTTTPLLSNAGFPRSINGTTTPGRAKPFTQSTKEAPIPLRHKQTNLNNKPHTTKARRHPVRLSMPRFPALSKHGSTSASPTLGIAKTRIRSFRSLPTKQRRTTSASPRRTSSVKTQH